MTETFQVVFDWISDHHPRDENGRFLPTNPEDAPEKHREQIVRARELRESWKQGNLNAARWSLTYLQQAQEGKEGAPSVKAALEVVAYALKQMTVAQLKAFKGELGIEATGKNKSALIERMAGKIEAKLLAQRDADRIKDAEARKRSEEAAKSGKLPEFPESKATVKTPDDLRDKQKVLDAVRSIFGGKVLLPQLASLVGAPDGATVKVYPSYNHGELQLDISHPDIEKCQRSIARHGDEIVIHNDYFKVPQDKREEGIGMKIFGAQIHWAQKLGVARIETFAARSAPTHNSETGQMVPGMNGYYTWPRFGYDQPIRKFGGPIRAKIEEKFPEAQSVLDIMKTKDGRDWWKEHGKGMEEAVFDLTPGSRSCQIYAQYHAERTAQKAGK